MILTYCRLLVTPVFKNVSSVPTFTQGTHVYLCHSTMAKKNVSFFFIHYITHMAIFLDSVYQLLIFYCTIRPHQHYHLPPHQQDSCRVQLPSQWVEIISEEALFFFCNRRYSLMSFGRPQLYLSEALPFTYDSVCCYMTRQNQLTNSINQ